MFHFTELELAIMTDLKVISRIRDNERILTRSKCLAIDQDDRLQFIRRWARGENRTDNVSRLISVFNQVFDIISSEKKDCKKRYFVDEIRKARKGLASLQITYREDSHICSSLDLLIDRIDKIVSFHTNLTFP